MHKEIIELVKKILSENDPQQLLPLLKLARERLAEEPVRLQALADRNTAMRSALQLGS